MTPVHRWKTRAEETRTVSTRQRSNLAVAVVVVDNLARPLAAFEGFGTFTNDNAPAFGLGRRL